METAAKFHDDPDILGSHVGLIFNRKVYGAVAGALALPELPTDRPLAATQRGGVAET